MMAVGRDRGRHGQESGSHDRCARTRAVQAAARPIRAAVKPASKNFRFVMQLRLQHARGPPNAARHLPGKANSERVLGEARRGRAPARLLAGMGGTGSVLSAGREARDLQESLAYLNYITKQSYACSHNLLLCTTATSSVTSVVARGSVSLPTCP